jgi:hypothetical protein
MIAKLTVISDIFATRREAGHTAVDDRRIDYIFGPPSQSLRRAELLRARRPDGSLAGAN